MRYDALALTLLLTSASSAAEPEHDVLRIENICIMKLPGVEYTRRSVADFTIVTAKEKRKILFTLYVGTNPDMRGPNAGYLSREKYDTGRYQRVKLTSPQKGEILGIPKTKYENYYHLMVSTREPRYASIVNAVDFCASSNTSSAK